VVAVPCEVPGQLRLDRQLLDSKRTDGVARGALGALLRSPTFLAAASDALERCASIELDGTVARAVPHETLDERGVEDLVQRLSLVAVVACTLLADASAGKRSRETHVDGRGPWVEDEPLKESLPYFHGPVHELVAIGLYRPALESLCRGERTIPAPPIDRTYLLRILSEEMSRQFCHPLRPIVELVLNGVDACDDGNRRVDVTLRPERVEVTDHGVGMNLPTILSRLLIPFATDKQAGMDIGRFGVGFFSVLGLGVVDPSSFSLEITTGDGPEAFSLYVVAHGADAASLECTVRRAPPQRGTHVCVRSELFDADSVRAYLRDTLHFLPPKRALVRLDGTAINDGSLIRGGRAFEDLAWEGPPKISGRFHLGGHALSPGITAATYHAGVKVESSIAISELALIDFPPEIELTEGRDAIKPGPRVDAVASAFHRRLGRIAKEARADKPSRHRLAEVAAQVSGLLLQSAGWNDAAPTLADKLLGADRYLVAPERVEALMGFLGAEIAERFFVPESFWAEREWHHYLPGEKELLELTLSVGASGSLDELARSRRELPGLAVFAARTPNPAAVNVVLVRSTGGELGTLPCLGTAHALLVREDAPALGRVLGWTDSYALRAAFDRAMGAREADVEREIIVGDPIRAGLCK
jgi:hypothetical protein